MSIIAVTMINATTTPSSANIQIHLSSQRSRDFKDSSQNFQTTIPTISYLGPDYMHQSTEHVCCKLHIPRRIGIVHLFEWNFKSIAEECENFLSTHGYGGVQVSPVNEYLILEGRPWFERYQPFSYKIISRSGNEEQFADMVRRCNNAGIRVYVDVVINHMSGNSSNPIGVGGSVADTYSKSYPDAGYTMEDFHETCQIDDWTSVIKMRNCELVGLHDLDQSKDNVRRRLIDFLNNIIDHGVAGIRVDAAKHVWPDDLKYIYMNLHDLNTKYFSNGSRPFIYQEVTDMGGEPISAKEYSSFGRVTDFTFGSNLGKIFHKQKTLSSLKNYVTLLDDDEGFVFVDNHDNQRGHGAGGDVILTYKLPKPYKMALGFTLAWPYGTVRIMSSYYFSDPSQGPPHNDDFSLKDVEYYWDGTCSNGYVCEHRWRQIYNMNKFRSIVAGTNVTNWWDDGADQIAFSRGNKGFIAFNNNGYKLFERLQTGMAPGYYCDIVSGEKLDGSCTGKLIVVGNDGFAFVYIGANDFDGFIAIHEKSRLWNPSQSYFKKINKTMRFNKKMYLKRLSKKKRSIFQ